MAKKGGVRYASKGNRREACREALRMVKEILDWAKNMMIED